MISHRDDHMAAAVRRTLTFFLCFGMAFFLFTGNLSAQEKSVKSSKVPKLFSSFGLKGKSKEGEPKKTTAKPKTPAEPPKKAVETETKPAAESKTDSTTQAPLPPDADFSNTAARSEQAAPVSKSPLENGDATPIETSSAEESTVGLSSYSFDSRDWVEYYPVDNNPPQTTTAEQQPGQQHPPTQVAVADPFSSNQTTAVTGPTPEIQPRKPIVARKTNPPAPSPESMKKPAPSHDWNGTAMPVAPAENKTIRVASTRPNEVRLPRKAPEEVSIDLTPSYSEQLKYTEICGVVVVQSNFPLTEIRAILEEIRLLQRDLNLYMGVPAPKEKIELCLFKSESTYVNFLREVFPKAPRDRRALYIKLDNMPGTLLVQKTEEFEVDLRHEMTHAIIHASIQNVPIWLDEGLAKYFEVPIQDRANDNPYMERVRWNVRFGSVPPLEKLEKLEHIGQMGTREYRDSWAWTHFMIHHSPQTHRLLAGYLQVLATIPESESGKVHVPPLSPYLSDLIKDPRNSYRKHFRSIEDPEDEF